MCTYPFLTLTDMSSGPFHPVVTRLSWKKTSQNGLHEPINRYNHGISPDHSKLEHICIVTCPCLDFTHDPTCLHLCNVSIHPWLSQCLLILHRSKRYRFTHVQHVTCLVKNQTSNITKSTSQDSIEEQFKLQWNRCRCRLLRVLIRIYHEVRFLCYMMS